MGARSKSKNSFSSSNAGYGAMTTFNSTRRNLENPNELKSQKSPTNSVTRGVRMV